MAPDTSSAPGPSALYFSRVMHKRLIPFGHRFDYRVFSLLLDLDDLDGLDRRLRLFSHNRFNLFSLHDKDHGPRDGSPLRPWLDRLLADAGIDLAGGPVRMLCFPRVLGYVFNPLTLYFCHRPDGSLAAMLYEVRNTFGQMHSYLIPVEADQAAGGPIRQSCDKRFYVSPFMGMEATYRFLLRVPDERLSVLIRQSTPAGETLIASQTGRRAPLTDGGLLRAFLTHPLVTLKVMGAIHWQALKLWRKGARFHSRPSPPDRAVTHAMLAESPISRQALLDR